MCYCYTRYFGGFTKLKQTLIIPPYFLAILKWKLIWLILLLVFITIANLFILFILLLFLNFVSRSYSKQIFSFYYSLCFIVIIIIIIYLLNVVCCITFHSEIESRGLTKLKIIRSLYLNITSLIIRLILIFLVLVKI